MRTTTHTVGILGHLVWLLGLVVVVFAAPSAQAQTYYYYPSSAPAAPTPTVATPQYYRTWTGRLVYVMTYAPQYSEPTPVAQPVQATEPVQTVEAPAAPQYIETGYVAEVSGAATVPGEEVRPAETKEAEPASDPYGFTAWLNATRAAYGLPPVGYDPNLSNWAASNNEQQAARGMGHFVMGPARRQNAAMGGFPGVETMWMNSPAHQAALLDPTIRWIGIAGLGAYWTFNAY